MKRALCYITIILVIIPLVAIIQSCNKSQPTRHFVIAVSQCSQDIWRDKLNDELKMEAYFHDNVELQFECANAQSIGNNHTCN